MPELIPAAPGSPEWLAARRTGVTATDIVTILGLSSWSSPYSLFWQKMGQVPETPDNDRFRLGRCLEPYAITRWAEEHRELRVTGHGSTWRHSDRAWQMATPDRFLYDVASLDDMTAPMAGVLEVKTWADADRHSWHDGPPPAVRAQVLWQMDVMDVAAGHVGVVFLPSGEFRSYTIEHGNCQATEASERIGGDPPCSACTDIALMEAEGEIFMQRLRLELPAPDPDASAATLAAVKARFARQPDKTAEVDSVVYGLWSDAKNREAEWSAKARGYESEIREQAGEASVLTVDGQPVARRITGEAQVKAHTRHTDYLRRIAPKETDSE